MAYSYETSSVKTINGEVSGLADVVARQALSAQMSLSAGEGINFVEDAENHRTRIDLGISAGSNMSFVYDQETNTYRLDAEGGGANYSGISPIVVNNTTNQISADTWSFSAGNSISFVDDIENKITRIDVNENFSNYYTKTETSSKQEISAALQYISANAGHAYSGDDPIYVNNETNHIGITGESLSAGPNIDIFSSGGYVVISANGSGGGGGAIYNGISPIDVNNTTHQISAKGVPFGVQEPLYFVQDDNEALIIGCSAVSANNVNTIVYTASLPATPDANTLYLIPEA